MDQQKQNILILDGGHKKTLAIVRSIGKSKKYILDVGASNKRAISYFSRYTGHRILFPDPRKEPMRYKEAIVEVLKIKKYLTVIPSDYLSFQLCAEIKDEINALSHISIVEAELIKQAGDKQWVHNIAESLGIPVPRSKFLSQKEDSESLIDEYGYVLKSAHESGDSFIDYPKNNPEAKSTALSYLKSNPGKVLIAQEKVSGDGYGFFAYYKNGVCQNHFIHHRLREYPPSGGYSVAAEGFRDQEIENHGKKILDHLKWNGVAMVEFKKDNNLDKYVLLEINAKFWGSLDLAIANGVDFPQMWIDDALGNRIKHLESYSMRKFQWLLNGELLHLIERPSSFGKVFIDLFYAQNDIWFTDLKPNLFQIANIFVHYYKKWFR